MRIATRAYLWYKLFNSLFAGAAMGAVFAIYAALDPVIFSAGGLLLAAGMIVVAKLYARIMFVRAFFIITLLVEGVMLGVVILYLLRPESALIALMVYSGYQVMFLFGSYLVRAETRFLNRIQLLSWIDVRKQVGYLSGLAISWVAYRWMERGLFIEEKSMQVWHLHWGLLIVQLVVLMLVWRAFRPASRA